MTQTAMGLVTSWKLMVAPIRALATTIELLLKMTGRALTQLRITTAQEHVRMTQTAMGLVTSLKLMVAQMRPRATTIEMLLKMTAHVRTQQSFMTATVNV